MAATARAFALHASPSVAHVIEIGGVGRGTFYEYFDDVEHARAAAVSAMQRRAESVLRAAERRARTPVERFRVLAAAWLELAESEAAGTLVALRIEAGARTTLAPLGAEFDASLTRSLDALAQAGMVHGERDPWRTLAVAAAAEVFARRVANHVLGGELSTGSAGGSPLDRAAAERALVDVQVRLLR